MARTSYLFTSESVSEGHPDKVCDRISDTVVDLFLARDPVARVACETLTTTNRIVLAGETRCASDVPGEEIEAAVRAAVRDIGYEQDGFHWETANFANYLHEQSADIAQGVDEGAGAYKEEGAGDQGIMFGFACDETPELMPAPISYSHKILKEMARVRKSGERPEFEPDAKSQVTLRYENGRPVAVTSVVVSTQHKDGVSLEQVRELVRPIVKQVLPEGWFPDEDEFYVNPTGKFVIGGPDGDAGLTGRKIIVDTYGGAAPMAAARSRARIPRRWTARRPMCRAIWPRMSWPRAWRRNAPSSCPTRSAWPSRSPSMSTCTARARLMKRCWKSACRRWSICPRAASAPISA